MSIYSNDFTPARKPGERLDREQQIVDMRAAVEAEFQSLVGMMLVHVSVVNPDGWETNLSLEFSNGRAVRIGGGTSSGVDSLFLEWFDCDPREPAVNPETPKSADP